MNLIIFIILLINGRGYLSCLEEKKKKIEGISDKLEYLGLDLDNIPEKFKKFESLEYRVPRFYDEKQYRQYRYIDIKDIQILLSPTNRL